MRYWCLTNSKEYNNNLRLRFEQKTNIGQSGCILWIGSRIGPYGQIKVRNRNTLAHRVAAHLAGFKFTDDQDILHKCDVCLCVNPQHLFVGNHAENMRDKAKKGRAPAKLNAQKVARIKGLIKEGRSCNSIAIEYGVVPHTIYDIRDGTTWAYITILSPLGRSRP